MGIDFGQADLFADQKQTGASAFAWQPERAAGLARLKAFVPLAGKAYAARRNYDLGPQNRSNISCLSPYIRYRLVTEQDVLSATLARHSLSSSEKFVQEVFWRNYFKGWLEHRPSLWLNYQTQLQTALNHLDRASDQRSGYEAAIQGKTSIECFDHWAQELIETGYLHNHARMWFASIWIFTLRLPWQLGADFFYRHLLDGDPASNTLSWRWVAGLHTKGKHYVARASNIEKFTNGRFEPPILNEQAIPLYEDVEYLPAPLNLPAINSPQVPDQGPYGLMISEEDCRPETLDLPHAPASVFTLPAIADRSVLPTHARVLNFTEGALNDAGKRAGTHFDCEIIKADPNNLTESMIDWAKSKGFSHLVTAYCPIGPAQSRLIELRQILSEAGIDVTQLVRPYDRAAWPHATKGFFKLKQKIPNLMSQGSLAEIL